MTNIELPSPTMFKNKKHSQKKGSTNLTQSSYLMLKPEASLDSLDFRQTFTQSAARPVEQCYSELLDSRHTFSHSILSISNEVH